MNFVISNAPKGYIQVLFFQERIQSENCLIQCRLDAQIFKQSSWGSLPFLQQQLDLAMDNWRSEFVQKGHSCSVSMLQYNVHREPLLEKVQEHLRVGSCRLSHSLSDAWWGHALNSRTLHTASPKHWEQKQNEITYGRTTETFLPTLLYGGVQVVHLNI